MPRWVRYTVLTMLLWGAWGTLSKPLSAVLSSWQVQALSTVGMLPVIVWLGCSRQLWEGSNPRRGFWLGLGAGVIGSLGNVACFQALAGGGKAAAVIPLTSLYPLVTIALALVFLRERLGHVQAAGVFLSVAAIVCFSGGEGASLLSPWVILALVPITAWGAGALLQKLATAHASSDLITLGFLAGFLPMALLTPLWEPVGWRLPLGTWVGVLLLGLLFGLGNLTLIHAYGNGGRAAVVTPLASLYSLVTIPLAILLLGERVSTRETIGIALALMAVVALCRETTNPQPP